MSNLDKVVDFVISLHESCPQKWIGLYPHRTYFRDTQIIYFDILGDILVKLGKDEIQVNRWSHKRRVKRLYRNFENCENEAQIEAINRKAEEIARKLLEDAKVL